MHFIFDIDGTISFKGQPVSETILDCLHELQSSRHVIGFASARPCRDMLPVLDSRFHQNLLIGANGAMTHFGGEPVAVNPIPEALAREIIGILDSYHASYLIDDEWNYAYNCGEDHPFLMNVDALQLARRVELTDLKHVVKLLVLSCDHFEELAKTMEGLNVTIHYHSSEGILDITNQGVNKMAAIRSYGIAPRQFTCFGNDMNDIPMFQEAGTAVAIGSFAGLTPFATHRLETVDQDIEHRIVDMLKDLASKSEEVLLSR
ncbi:HAD-IIB family hydrolase [Paenibacillus sp. MER TA 81-3]|uniref:HAD-IIB family hydrolase n=1 Tax=Paenibacillus sp. MER TA 81-3 TaxID=2939573 RepID=UPI00203FEA26|nr:HAD-IIB family hydrolase [Paenibacillus sp. MER TA 81-3]MCM3340003.1 HAD-IIB family hydrolase [Paenibacillus sp. MER TA 81-3]